MITVLHLCTSAVDTRYFKTLIPGLADRGIKVWCGSLTSQTGDFQLGARTKLHYPGAVLNLARVLRMRHVDLIHTHLFDAGLVGIAAARLTGTKAILGRHHADDIRAAGFRVHAALDKAMAAAADAVIVNSRAVQRMMIEEEGVKTPISVVHYGYDFPEPNSRAVRSEFGSDSDFLIGQFGRLVPVKGHRYTLRAAAQLLPRIPNLRVVFFGDGPDKHIVARQAVELGIADRVRFAGYRNDVFDCMAAMDVIVQPSLVEAFGQVVIEAMAAGTPVVATRVGGMPEIIEDHESGLLIPPADDQSLASAIEELYQNQKLTADLSSRAREVRATRFTAAAMLHKYVDCYRKVLGVESL